MVSPARRTLGVVITSSALTLVPSQFHPDVGATTGDVQSTQSHDISRIYERQYHAHQHAIAALSHWIPDRTGIFHQVAVFSSEFVCLFAGDEVYAGTPAFVVLWRLL